jgi:hypothetical protein
MSELQGPGRGAIEAQEARGLDHRRSDLAAPAGASHTICLPGSQGRFGLARRASGAQERTGAQGAETAQGGARAGDAADTVKPTGAGETTRAEAAQAGGSQGGEAATATGDAYEVAVESEPEAYGPY